MIKAEYVNNTNDDLTSVNSARVSMDKHSNVFTLKKDIKKGSDEGLVYYLADHDHWTPFSHCRTSFKFPQDNIIHMFYNIQPKDFQHIMAGMVVDIKDNLIRHSAYGWIQIIKLGILEDYTFDIIAYLSKLYPYMMKAYDLYDDKYQEVLDKTRVVNINNEQHDPPFVDVTMRETIPIFVARQRFKHMVGFTYNEVSRRYVDDIPEFFIPDYWRQKAANVKQGSKDESHDMIMTVDDGWSPPYNIDLKDWFNKYIDEGKELYEYMILEEVAPEQARMFLPQNMLTSYYVTGNLISWARAYKQRIDSHAQKEIQILAQQWDEILTEQKGDVWIKAKEIYGV